MPSYEPVGDDFRVNTTTTLAQNQSRVEELGTGFIVVWTDASATGSDTSGTAIRAQRYDAEGVAVGTEFVVNTTTLNGQNLPVVTELAGGGFVVTWEHANDGNGTGIRARVYDQNGVALANDFAVNNITQNIQTAPSIHALGTGFIVTWQGNDGGFSSGVKARVFDASGTPVADEFLVNTDVANSQINPVITTLASGGYAIVWGDNSTAQAVEVQLFNADGSKRGGEIIVDTFQSANPEIVELQGGNILVAWQGGGAVGDTGDSAISAAIYDANGNVVKTEFLVNTLTTGNQTDVTIAALPDGGFVAAWTTDVNFPVAARQIKAQVFDSAGDKVGDEFVVNTVSNNDQTQPNITVLDSGGFVISWTDASLVGDTSGTGIRARIFEPVLTGPVDITLSTETISETAINNLPVASLTTRGADGTSYTYQLTADSTGGAFGINVDKLVVVDNSKLDFESGTTATVTLLVTDNLGNTYEEEFVLDVSDAVIERRFSAGDELLANTQTSDLQVEASLGALTSGGYVVAWTDNSQLGDDTSGTGIKAQLFGADGSPVGSEFLVNTVTSGAQGEVSIAGLASGGFVVTWQDASTGGIKARIFDAGANEVVGEFVVNTAPVSDQFSPDVAALPDGGFVITWTASSVKAQVFDAGGNKVGSEILVDDMFDVVSPQVTVLENGNFALVWEGSAGDGAIVIDAPAEPTDYGTWAQIYDTSGNAVSGKISVDTPTAAFSLRNPAITALDSGGFVATWTASSGDGSGRTVMGQLFNADGSKDGAAFVANTASLNSQDYSSVTVIDGGFVVAWRDGSGQGFDSSAGVKAQVFDNDGNKVGDEFLVNAATADAQHVTSVQGLAGGGFVIGWHDLSGVGGDGDSFGIKIRQFDEIISNVAPVVDLNGADAGVDFASAYTEGGAAAAVGDTDVLITDADVGDNVASVTITVTNAEAGDTLTVVGTLPGSIVVDPASTDTMLILSGAGTAAEYEAAIEQVTFSNTGDNPTDGGANTSRTITTVVNDGLEDSAPATTTIDVTGVNDAPETTAPATRSGKEDVNLVFSSFNGNEIVVGDIDGDALTVTLSVTQGTLTLAGTAGLTFTTGDGTGDMEMTFSGSAEDINAALDGLVYRGAQDYVGDDTLTITTSDGEAEDVDTVAITLADGEIYIGTPGNDDFSATSNEDWQLYGLGSSDSLNGAGGDDYIDGGEGADTMWGGDGNDIFIVDNAGDETIEDSSTGGTDEVRASVSFSIAGQFIETLDLTGTGSINGTGNGLDNVLLGTSGDNVLNGGAGADAMTGEEGNDTYIVDNAGDTVTELVDGGLDIVLSSVSYQLSLYTERLTLTGTGNINATGSALAEVLTGNSGNNVLDGRFGADTMTGGAGDDTYIVNNAGDMVTELLDEGTDNVRSTVGYTLGAHLENLTLTGTGSVSGTGNDLDNVITGNQGGNRLDGGAGADTLIGGRGNDVYVIDAADTIVEVGGGIDTVESAIGYTLGAHLENLTLTGTDNINGMGNSVANVLTGNSGNNVLDGGFGADTMAGGAGDDTYIVNEVGDVVTELDLGGTDSVQSSASHTLSAFVENLKLTGTGSSSGTGNDLDNVITGNAGANALNGRGGNDTLRGGSGADGFYFDTALGANNVDTIIDFSPAADTIFLDSAIFDAIGNGVLDADAFHKGATAQDAEDRIVYDAATGNLFYDADGSGAGEAILFATINRGTSLNHLDFVAYIGG